MNLHIKNRIKRLIPNKTLSFLRNYKTKIKSISGTKKLDLLQFEVHLADHCNLNCKGCLHFSPLIKEEFMDINSFKNDCLRLNELTNGQIKFIRFMGGEPLLHPNLIEFLDTGRKYFPDGELIIVTNGILLPNQSEMFWENCKKNNIEIQVSNYPIKIDKEQINFLAKKYKITIDYVGGKKTIIWRAMKLDLEGKQNIKENFGLCSQANVCIHLNNGKLFTCPVAAYIKHFNNYFGKNLQVTENDYIDIYKADKIDDIVEFLSKPIPFCKYCDVRAERDVEWEVSKKEIEEWL